MRSNLMTLGNHPPHQSLAVFRQNTLPVIAIDKERGRDVAVFEKIEDLGCVNVGSVIERDGEGSRLGAATNDASDRYGRGCYRCSGRCIFLGGGLFGRSGLGFWTLASPGGNASARLGRERDGTGNKGPAAQKKEGEQLHQGRDIRRMSRKIRERR